MKSILLNLPKELKEKLKEAAKSKEMSVSGFLRFLIKKELTRMGLL